MTDPPDVRLPDLPAILAARRRITGHLRPTPLYCYPRLSVALGCRAYVKHENHQPVGSFKVRGAVNLVGQLSQQGVGGVIVASTGNHGQSVAYAAHRFGLRAVIVVPEGANPEKVAAIEAWGGEVRHVGRIYDEARAYVEEVAEREGLRYIHSANEPELVAGVGTIGLEMLEACPEVEVILVPVGGGHGCAGILIAVKTLSPTVEVIAVQAEGAPAAYRSWREDRLVEEERMDTFAEGLQTRVGFALPQRAFQTYGLDDFILVSDEELGASIRLLWGCTHNLAEGAGAASTAGAVKLRERLAGRTVILDLSGGNLSVEKLRQIFCAKR